MAEVAGNSSGMDEMSQLIRLKERELHEVQDMRCGALERMVEERDQLVSDVTKRFEQLKEDFSYNLTLLEARDKEIDRLEVSLSGKSTELEENETERRTLVSRMEVLELRDAERSEKHILEKNNSKRILQELKDAIESMKWAASEEAKSKQREIDVVREDNRVLAASREESLESQRRDLTSTFEQLISHREMHYGAREKKLGSQILALDSKFEALNTENSRLKSDLQGAQRLVESTQRDLQQDKEKVQALSWQLDDERALRQRSCDALERQVQDLSAELQNQNDDGEKGKSALRAELDTARQEAEREKEFRVTLEKRLGEYRDSSKSSLSYLEAELAAKGGSENRLKADLLKTSEERDALMEAVAALQSEAASGRRRIEELQEGSLEGIEQLAQCRHELSQAKNLLDVREAEALLAAQKAGEKEGELTEALQAATELASTTQASLQALQETQDALSQRAYTLEAQLSEEKEEAAALQLRIRLQESQMHALKADASAKGGNSANTTATTPAAITGKQQQQGEEREKEGEGAAGRGRGLGIDPADPASPIFSEDYGPVSLPASPLATPNPNYTGNDNNNNNNNNNDKGVTESNESAFGIGVRDSQPPRTFSDSIDAHPGRAARAQALAQAQAQGQHMPGADGALTAENDRLKAVIKEMRADMEQLQEQVLDQSTLMGNTGRSNGNGNNNGGGTEEYEEMKRRLERTAAEVVRLKAERKTLMDIGNELRSALNQEYSMQQQRGGDNSNGNNNNSRRREVYLPPVPPVEPYGTHDLPAHARTGPMFMDYRYDAPDQQVGNQRGGYSRGAGGYQDGAGRFYPPDSISVVNAFEGDHPDHHAQTSDTISGIGVRGRTMGGHPPGGNGGYQRGYAASANRSGVNTHSRYSGTAATATTTATTGTTGAATGRTVTASVSRGGGGSSSNSSNPPSANALSRAASAANRQPRKVMNYAKGFKEQQDAAGR
jgi:hypothetical protein